MWVAKITTKKCVTLLFFFFFIGEGIELKSSEINSAGIFKQSMGARNRVGIGLLYRPARLHTELAELVLWNRILGFLKVLKFGSEVGGITLFIKCDKWMDKDSNISLFKYPTINLPN